MGQQELVRRWQRVVRKDKTRKEEDFLPPKTTEGCGARRRLLVCTDPHTGAAGVELSLLLKSSSSFHLLPYAAVEKKRPLRRHEKSRKVTGPWDGPKGTESARARGRADASVAIFSTGEKEGG